LLSERRLSEAFTRPSLEIRRGRSEDADRLAVLATQVWLHTYATSGITADIAEYVLLELTPEKFRVVLHDPTCQVFVAASGESLAGLAVVKFGILCPAGQHSSAELKTLYVQEHFLGCRAGKSLLRSAEAEARQRSNGVLWLTLNAKNARAITFYAHQGYTKAGTTYFVLGKGHHENHVLMGADA
jgi:ribosomal protein S18 acetylase RimI-like enzyme